MAILPGAPAHIQDILRFDFLFTGLEVSSTTVLVIRSVLLLVFGVGLGWAVLRIALKALDCVYAFISSLGKLPWSFFMLVLLAVPLSRESLGSQWTGYLLIIICLFGVAATGTLLVVLWKYGVDQALRLIAGIRGRRREPLAAGAEAGRSTENMVGPALNPPGVA
jgi:hypothetical protein